MTNHSQVAKHVSRHSGRTAVWLLIGLVAIAAGAGLYLVTRGTDEAEPVKPRTSQEDIDARLDALQQAFQQGLQDGQDLARLESRVDLFTRDHPDDATGHVLLAQVRMQRQQWRPAYAAWLSAIGQEPNEPEFYKMAGLCGAELGQIETALGHYQDAVRLAGDAADSDTYAALGLLYLVLDRLDEAEAAYRAALTAPGPGEKTNWRHRARSGLADVAAARGDFETALREIDEAIDWADKDSAADLTGYMIQKARIYMDAGRNDDAATMLAYTGAEYPRAAWRIESARLRAKLYEHAGDTRRAVNHVHTVTEYWYQQPERNDAELAEFVALLAEWQVKAGDHDAARTSLHNLETLSPEHAKIGVLRKAIR